MAVDTHFEVVEAKGKLQPTQVGATIKVIRLHDAPPIVQIDTGGSSERETPGKVIQTLQLTKERAVQLHAILGRIYGL